MAFVEILLDYTAKNEIDALFVTRGQPFTSVPLQDHAGTPVSPASPLFQARPTSVATDTGSATPTATSTLSGTFTRIGDGGNHHTTDRFQLYSKVRPGHESVACGYRQS